MKDKDTLDKISNLVKQEKPMKKEDFFKKLNKYHLDDSIIEDDRKNRTNKIIKSTS